MNSMWKSDKVLCGRDEILHGFLDGGGATERFVGDLVSVCAEELQKRVGGVLLDLLELRSRCWWQGWLRLRGGLGGAWDGCLTSTRRRGEGASSGRPQRLRESRKHGPCRHVRDVNMCASCYATLCSGCVEEW